MEAAMRKITLLSLALVLLLALVAVPAASSQARLDVGFFAPRGVGVSGGGDINTAMANWPFIPIPDIGIYYQGDVGPLKLGIGARGFSALIETFAWPNAYAELNVGPLAIEAQFGGGLFAMFGLAGTDFVAGKAFIPDLSAWFKLGKKGVIRLGGGAMGVYIPDVTNNTMPFLIYFGGKAAIML
jgi:hypothetical protein